MNRLLNCQKFRHILSLGLLISTTFFGVNSTAVSKETKVIGVIDDLNELDNSYEIKIHDIKQTYKITKATAMKEEDLVALKDSYQKKNAVELAVKGSEVVGIKVAEVKKSTTASGEVKKNEKVIMPGKPVVGTLAPEFVSKTHEGKEFSLVDRKGKWTVLYFYPKAETPGCTKQACAFRDSIKVIRALNADVFGISADTVEEQAAFHKHHSLTFTLLADPDARVIKMYGTKMPVMKMSRRTTFIIGPDLKIAHIEEGVDPVKDAGNVAQKLKELQAKH